MDICHQCLTLIHMINSLSHEFVVQYGIYISLCIYHTGTSYRKINSILHSHWCDNYILLAICSSQKCFWKSFFLKRVREWWPKYVCVFCRRICWIKVSSIINRKAYLIKLLIFTEKAISSNRLIKWIMCDAGMWTYIGGEIFILFIHRWFLT